MAHRVREPNAFLEGSGSLAVPEPRSQRAESSSGDFGTNQGAVYEQAAVYKQGLVGFAFGFTWFLFPFGSLLGLVKDCRSLAVKEPELSCKNEDICQIMGLLKYSNSSYVACS